MQYTVERQVLSDEVLWIQEYDVLTEVQVQALQDIRLDVLIAALAFNTEESQRQLLGRWMTWLFVWDDLVDGWLADPTYGIDHITYTTQALLVTLDGAATDVRHPMVRAWQDICRSSTGILSHGVKYHLHQFFQAVLWECQNRNEKRLAGRAEYLIMRPYTGGLYAYLALLEQCMYGTDTHALGHPMIDRLTYLVNIIVCFENDLQSVRQEAIRGDQHNLVLILARELGCDQQKAEALVRLDIEQYVQECLIINTLLPRYPQRKQFTLYNAMLQHFVYATVQWHHSSPRYHKDK